MSGFFDPHHPIWCDLGLALAHFLWQGAIIAVVLALALRFLRNRSAHDRYAACGLAMVSMAICPAVTLYVLDGGPQSASLVSISPARETLPATPPSRSGELARPLVGHDLSGGTGPHPWPAIGAEKQENTQGRLVSHAAMVWLGGVVVLAFRLLYGWVELKGRTRRSVPIPAAIESLAQRLSRQLGLARIVRMRACDSVWQPSVFGIWRPIILLPMSMATGAPPDLLEAVIAHELSHVRRHDLLVNLLQCVIETLLFYHPAVWWVSRRMRAERELCCDELAVRATGRRAEYAEALVSVSRLAGYMNQPLTAGMRPRGLALISRVRNVLRIPERSSTGRAWLAAPAVVILAISLAAIPYLRAEAEESEPRDRAQKQAVNRTLEAQEVEVVYSLHRDIPVGLEASFVEGPSTLFIESIRFHTQYGNSYGAVLRLRWRGVEEAHFRLIVHPVYREYVGRNTWRQDVTIGGKTAKEIPSSRAEIKFHILHRDYLPDPTEFLIRVEPTSAETDPTEDEEELRKILVHAIDRESRKPISGGSLVLAVPPSEGPLYEKRLHLYSPDAAGFCRISLPTHVPGMITLTAQKRGFVDLVRQLPGVSETGGAEHLQVALEPTATIGGVVVDEKDRPVEGATVGLQYSMTGEGGSDVCHTEIITDKNGRWRSGQAPKTLPSRAGISVRHPEFLSEFGFDPTPESLRKLEAKCILKDGLKIVGRVVDSAGRPIPGANVFQTFSGHGIRSIRTTTDGDGNFRIGNSRKGYAILAATSPRHAVAFKEINVEEEKESAELRLDPPMTIRGVLVDAKGRPITGAQVAAGWPGGHQNVLEWRTTTDEEGRWTFHTIPQEGMAFTFLAIGFRTQRDRPLRPSSEEQVITLTPAARIFGKVIDAATGDPISRFRITPGTKRSDKQTNPVDWMEYFSRFGKDGVYELSLSESFGVLDFVRIEAVGFLPAESEPFNVADGDQEIKFELTSSPGITGVALLPDGSPAVDARVGLIPHSRMHAFTVGELVRGFEIYDDWLYTRTDAEGEFKFPAQSEPHRIVIAEPRGYAESAFLTSPHILAVQPWSKIEGVLVIGGKPASAGQWIELRTSSGQTENMISRWDYTLTDKNGHFSFDRVGPGMIDLIWQVRTNEVIAGESHWTTVDVQPGETNVVTMIQNGLPVIGVVRLKGDAQNSINEFEMVGSLIRQGRGGVRARRSIPFLFAADGSFRAEDVPPGGYELEIRVKSPKVSRRRIDLGTVTRPVVVPDIGTDQPVDVGKFEIGTPSYLHIGDAAPSIRFETGGPATRQLQDFRGKLVLLHFWGVGVRPEARPLHQLSRLPDDVINDEQFVWLSLCCNERAKGDIAAAKEFVKGKKLTFVDGFLNSAARREAMEVFGIQNLPTAVLLGPDGRIIDPRFRLEYGSRIGEAVIRARAAARAE
jgi:beta-lactamase regulating signal transducer with metallopeptidase domain